MGTLLHYENGRTPPVDVLIRAAQVTRVNLSWLLTGKGGMEVSLSGVDLEVSSRTRSVLERLAKVLESDPQLLPFAEELIGVLGARLTLGPGSPEVLSSSDSPGGLIPIVGSTAAGPAHFWSELSSMTSGPETDRLLEARLEEYLNRPDWQQSISAGELSGLAGGRGVALVQYAAPQEGGYLEFLSAPEFKQQYPRAVAWRIDGDSMSPRFLDKDLVLTSPDFPAVSQHPCVSRQRDQIGVNCKLYVDRGEEILLVPINPASPVQAVSKDQLDWAWRVLATVRLR